MLGVKGLKLQRRELTFRCVDCKDWELSFSSVWNFTFKLLISSPAPYQFTPAARVKIEGSQTNIFQELIFLFRVLHFLTLAIFNLFCKLGGLLLPYRTFSYCVYVNTRTPPSAVITNIDLKICFYNT